jgi:hypothetical protein
MNNAVKSDWDFDLINSTRGGGGWLRWHFRVKKDFAKFIDIIASIRKFHISFFTRQRCETLVGDSEYLYKQIIKENLA